MIIAAAVQQNVNNGKCRDNSCDYHRNKWNSGGKVYSGKQADDGDYRGYDNECDCRIYQRRAGIKGRFDALFGVSRPYRSGDDGDQQSDQCDRKRN